MVPTGCHVGGYDHLREVGDLIGPVADSADVHVCDGIAVGHPELGVGSFEFRQVGNGPFGDARGVGLELVGTVLVGALAVVRPGEDDGNLGRRVGGAEDVGIQDDPVAHGDRYVLVADTPGCRLVSALVKGVGLAELFLVLGEFLELLDRGGDELLGVELVDNLPTHLGFHCELLASE